MRLEIFGTTNIGNIRELNEDTYAVNGFADSKPPGFCVLADGMGGHNAGEVASNDAVDFVSEKLLPDLGCPEEKIPGLLTEAVSYANEQIYELSLSTPQQHGMGTTLVIGYIAEGTAYIANVGDSRAYALRDGELCQITVDHSVVEELIAAGTITREEAFRHPQKNIITRAVGTEPTIRTDIYEYTFLAGDLLLLCSDGLTEMLTDAEIQAIVSAGGSARTAAEELTRAALDAGGHDNITVIVVRFLPEE